MKKHQVFAGRLIVLLLSLALLASPMAVAAAYGTAAAPFDPGNGSTIAAWNNHAAAHFGEELDTQGGTTLWFLEALAGVLAVVGLSEAVRRCYR
jgi:hypothetical protein